MGEYNRGTARIRSFSRRNLSGRLFFWGQRSEGFGKWPTCRLEIEGDSDEDIVAAQGVGRIASVSAIAHLDFRGPNDLWVMGEESPRKSFIEERVISEHPAPLATKEEKMLRIMSSSV